MRVLILGLFGTAVLTSLAQARPLKVMCYPAGLVEKNAKSLYFAYEDSQAKKKKCDLGKAIKLSKIKWETKVCELSESWTQYDFTIKKEKTKFTIKVFLDLTDGEHFQGVVFGQDKDQNIDQELTCDVEQSEQNE